MSNLSPGFSARFASIELDSATASAPPKTRSSRKQYPANLYPHNHNNASTTTPSKAPRLSTAARAETRSCSSQKSHITSSGSHKRNLHSVQGKEDRNVDENRHEDKHTRLNDTQNASFMKETSSSRKKQSSAAVHDRALPQVRSSSHSEIHTRRNHHYAVLASKKRQPSKSTRTSEAEMEPTLAVDVPFADKPTIFTSYSPSRNVSAGHTPRSQEDVYTRLYQSSQKPRSRPEKPNRPNFGLQEKSVSKRTPSTAKSTSPQPREKPTTISEMYLMIHKADPAFFTESNALDPQLTAQEPIPASDLINSQEGKHLTVYERGELMRNSSVYYVPQTWKDYTPDINVSSFKNNYGFDDKEGNYIVRSSDHIEYRYEIVRVLGTGSFGNVVHCKDHKYSARGQRRNVAIKLIKNELDWSLQAVSEIKMLKHLMAASHGKINSFIMNYCDHFHFRGHMCIVSEMLSLNLYTFLELGHFRGVSLSLVKNFAYKILKGLQFVHDQKVIHCDIKPENIMIRLPSNYNPGDSDVSGFDVKLIDFGSSCFESETSFSYIQSRFYRAPEVILGSKYSHEIDIWSFGCVLAELFTGSPLLPGKNELEQIALILEMFGAPPSSFVLAERKRLIRFMKMDTHRKLNDPLVSDPSVYANKPSIQVDEKKLKKTLLYTLFNLDGKINLQFLNMQLQAMEPKDHLQMPTSSPFKRNVRISARSLDVSLRLHGSGEDKADQTNFSRFMGSIFQWSPSARPKAIDLLQSPFLKEFA
ncbi:hypothetical protein OXX79_004490 [Metschnikowia pulcherrima]